MLSLTTLALAFSVVANGNVIYPKRQLAPAASSINSAIEAEVTLLSQNTVSKDPAPLESSTEDYYIGFREEDFKKPYAKYVIPLCGRFAVPFYQLTQQMLTKRKVLQP